MSLRKYRSKRDFELTPEPSGAHAATPEVVRRKYVIQKHHASHLHYDLRLEFDGVLKSWAVPRGPSMDPRDKRLAMEVEDHPLDYASFSGTMPVADGKGSESSTRAALRKGSLKFEVFGKKLKGKWALVRMKSDHDKRPWLLIKEKESSVTHASKILYPEAGIDKQDLADYYAKISKLMLPHIEGRPLMILRCPDGKDEPGFFQKNWSKSLPGAVKRIRGSSLLTVDSEEGLLALAQLGVLEIHAWNSCANDLERPDQFVIDIDPHERVPWGQIAGCAQAIRDELKRYGMKSFLKTTGGKGLHVVAPLTPSLSWEMGKAFCKALCEDIAAAHPSRYLTTMALKKRTGRIFLDYLRNGRGATAIAPYSPRARFEAPIAIPIDWRDLEKGVRSDSFHLREASNFLRQRRKDPWRGILEIRQQPRQL
jgi:DNA ligase D